MSETIKCKNCGHDIALVPYKTNSNIALLCARIPGDKKKCFALAGKTQGSKWF